MDDDQQFCLRWNNHQSTLISVFDTLLENETLVDCTLAAEGKFLKAHKVVLSACSPYFATLLQEQYDKHPIFILKDVKYQELRAMMDYMYRGEVNISQDQLAALLKAAESLQIKGLSDNRSGGGASQPKHPEHHRATMPGKLSGGYTLEQTKRARITGAAGPAMDASEMGSREGSSSPSRRRRKVRRRSIENPMTDVHDNSNSSQQPTQSNAPGLGAITAAASALAAAAAGAPSSAAAAAALASTVVPLSATQQQHQSSTSAVTPAATGTTLSSSKKTDNVKGSTQQHQQQQQDAINTDNVQGSAAGSLATGTPAMDTETATDASTADKSNHKQQLQQQQKGSASKDTSSVTGSELVIEPKAEYDDEANDETVEDLTLDEEDMGMDDLDHNAGTSQGGEGSSQGYAPWQHDRSQDELLLATQEAQQRDPQDVPGRLGSAGGGVAADYLQRRRHSNRLKRSPLTSPLPMAGPSLTTATTSVAGAMVAGPPVSGVIKFEPSTNLDDAEEEKYTLPHAAAGHHVGAEDDDDDDDGDDGGMESEQPCDLRLSSHFKLNLVSMVQAAAAAAAVSAGAAMIGGSASGTTVASGTSTGMTSATQFQQAALHTIAAVATSHQTPHGHGLHQSHAAAHGFMTFPPGPGGDTSPKRRYSSSSTSGGGGGGAATPVAGGLLNVASVTGGAAGPSAGGSGSTGLNASSTSGGGGPSTSAIVAPHTPSSAATAAAASGSAAGMSGSVGGQGVGGAGATVGSGSGGPGAGGSAPWGGAYTCDRCGNSYARPHSLNRHVRFECGVEPKFECPICHKKSKHKHNLVLHMRTHQHR